MPQKPLDISTSLFYPRAEEQQASLPGEQPYDADAARIHKSVRVCSHMVHHIGASDKMLAPIFFKSEYAHSAVHPFQTATAFAGVRIGFGKEPAGCQKKPGI